MEQVVTRWGDGEPGYRITEGGLAQLWRLVDTDRLEEAERVSLCLVLSEVESSRRDRSGGCATRAR
jgi:hypothetical protein